MKALEIERVKDDNGNVSNTVRALIWDIDDDLPHYKLLVDIFECETAVGAAWFALEAHPDTHYAKCEDNIAEPDCLTVSECARAMAGIW